jgi:hemerythrin-like domain-containing protein
MTMVNEPLADTRDMFAVHTMFRREFGLMQGLVQAVTPGDVGRAAIVADNIGLVTLTLDFHHSGEDKHVWPRLRERSPDKCAALVDVVEDQHHTVHAYLARVTEAEHAWRGSASADARDALADAIGQLLAALTEHLALEEERVVPLIDEYITQSEWSLVAQEGGADFPPDKLPLLFGKIMYEGDPEVIDMIVSHMPAEVQPIIKDVATQAFAANAQELYGTATPPRVTG